MAYYPPGLPARQNFTYFDYLVVIDFEATCFQDDIPKNFQPEIIQFPAVLVDVRRQLIMDEFCVYVKPVLNPTLSPFCTKLTGITQEEVSDAPEFPEALAMFEKWISSHQLGSLYTFAIVCDGSYDMGRFMYTQCEVSNIPYFPAAYQWVNIRKSFKNLYDVTWYSLRMVLDLLGQRFQGRPHNGLDDARNIASVLIRIIRDGGLIVQNEKIILKKSEQEKNKLYQQTQCNKPYSLCTVQSLSKRDFITCFHSNHIKVAVDTEELFRETVITSSNKENVLSTTSRGKATKKKVVKSKAKSVDPQNTPQEE